MRALFSINYILTILMFLKSSQEKLLFFGRFYFLKKKGAIIKNQSGKAVLIGKGVGPYADAFKKTRLVMEENSKLILNHKSLIGGGSTINLAPNSTLFIGEDTYLCSGTVIGVIEKVYIGKNCSISWNVTIMDDDGHNYGQKLISKPVHIGDHVWIGCNVTILKGVELGEGTMVAAGSVVTKSFPANSVIGGVPAKLIRQRNE